MAKEDLERSFPRLGESGYRITSPADARYNCAAWAVGEADRWWDPALEGGYYWPAGVPRLLSLLHLIAAFGTRGYEPSAHAGLEKDFEKVAIYADEHSWPTHVARQLPSGAWTSKMGVSEDIEHATLEALEGPLYGRAVQFLRKRRAQASNSGTKPS